MQRRNALRLARDRKQQRALRQEIENLRDQARAGLGPAGVDKIRSEAPLRSKAARPNSPQPTRPTTSPAPNRQAPTPAREPSRGIDLNFGGGGAVDPFTLLLVAGLTGGALTRRRRRRQQDRSE